MTGYAGVSRRRLSVGIVVAGVVLLAWGVLWVRSPTNSPRTIPPVDTVLVAVSTYVWVPALGAFGIVVGSAPTLRRRTRRSRPLCVGLAVCGAALVGVGGSFAAISLGSVAGAVYVSPLIGAGAVAIWASSSNPPGARR